MVQVVSSQTRSQARSAQRSLAQQQQRLQQQAQRLQTAAEVRRGGREGQIARQQQLKNISQTGKQLQKQTSQLERIANLPTKQEAIKAFQDRVKVANKLAQNPRVLLKDIPKEFRQAAREIREGKSNIKTLVTEFQNQVNQTISESAIKDLVIQARQGTKLSLTPQSIPFNLEIPESKPFDTISKAPTFKEQFVSARNKPLFLGKFGAQKAQAALARQGIKIDRRSIPDVDIGGLIRPTAREERIEEIVELKGVPGGGITPSGQTDITEVRTPTIKDVGKGILPPSQEAEIKANDVFLRLNQGKISEIQAESELKAIERKFNLDQAKREAPIEFATGAALTGLSIVAPPIGAALFGASTLSAAKERKQLIKFAKENPKAAGIRFGSGLAGGVVAGGGLAGIRSLRAAELKSATPKIKLVGGKTQQTFLSKYVNQVEPELNALVQKGNIKGIKSYEVKLPTTKGDLVLKVAEYEKNGVKQFVVKEFLDGKELPSVTRGEAIASKASGSNGLQKLITRTLKITQQEKRNKLRPVDRQKFNVELRQILEKVSQETENIKTTDIGKLKIPIKKTSITKTEARITPFAKVKKVPKSKDLVFESARQKGTIKADKPKTNFQKNIIKELKLKGVSESLAVKFANSKLFNKADIVNKLKQPFTEKQFNQAIKSGDSRFITQSKVTDIIIKSDTGPGKSLFGIGIQAVQKGKSLPKGAKPKIKVDKKTLKIPKKTGLEAEAAKTARLLGAPKPRIKPVKKLGQVALSLEKKLKSPIQIADQSVPSPLGAFKTLARSSQKQLLDSQIKSTSAVAGAKAIRGAGLPRAVGGLGRDSLLRSDPISRTPVEISNKGILDISKDIGAPEPSLREIEFIQTKLDSGVRPLLNSISGLSLSQRKKLLGGSSISQVVPTNQKINPTQNVRLNVGVKQLQKLRQRQKQLQKQKPKQKTGQPSKPTTPFRPRFPIITSQVGASREKIGTPKNKKGYDAFVKQGKKFIKVNEVPLTKEKARDIATFVTDKSLAATWKVKKTGKLAKKPVRIVPNKYFLRNQAKYRSFKKVKGKEVAISNSGIERRKFRLDSGPEVRKIQAERFAKGLSRRVTKKVKRLI